MELISIISTLGGFIIAGISIYLNYKARTSPYREALYSKQIEGYVKLTNVIIDFNTKALDFINKGGSKTEGGLERQLQAWEALLNIRLEYLKWTVLLRKGMGSLVINFTEECERILDLPFNKENTDLLGDALIEILNEIRNYIGAEPLSREILELIGKIKS